MVVDSNKNQQSMLKPLGEQLSRNDIHSCKVQLDINRLFINYKGTNYLHSGESWWTPLSQMIKDNITNNRMSCDP